MVRPAKHFTPQKGWMNDPNGPVFFRGRYHLFFQHDPDSLIWDRMHWGHAVSDDLLHWEHLPMALFPDEMGDIYSGSAVVDLDNVSGLGSREAPALLLYYTSHHMETKREQQCLAYSRDGVTFAKYVGNPIIQGKEHTPSRDPHVFRNPVLGGFSMCFTTEKTIEFYHSEDLVTWKKTGALVLPDYALAGMIECPCMFPCKVEEVSEEREEAYGDTGIPCCEEESRYVLMMSMDIPEEEFSKLPQGCAPHRRLMQYLVGDFDGEVFRPLHDIRRPRLVDYGPDFYAGTIFSNLQEPVLIAWLGDFAGERKVNMEEDGYCGILSFPRKLSLLRKDGVYLLKQCFFCGKSTHVMPDEGCDSADPGDHLAETGRLLDVCVEEEISEDGLISRTSFFTP